MVRPLDRLPSIKVKLAFVIVAAVVVTLAAIVIARRVGIPVRIGIIAATLIALGTIVFLARGMTAPLREMAAAAREMERGQYGRRVTATSRDEVGELGRAFNRMASELEQVDVMRRDLIANVSHELKTPIAGLRAKLENLIDGVEQPEPEGLAIMLGQVDRLGLMIDELLDLSKLESGTVEIEREPFQLQGLLHRVIDETKLHLPSIGRGKELEFKVDVAREIEIVGDAHRLHQVFANVVENAVRHSPQRGEISITATRSNELIRIAIDDQGPGIAVGDAERVFERFYRSSDSVAFPDGGTGLGLAIARWIVELHEGKIVASTAQGGGARIAVELPRKGLPSEH